jgi:magnesium transporter
MIRSFVFDQGKLVGENVELDGLPILWADKGLTVWVDLESPTPEETKRVLEDVMKFHPLAIEDCVQPSPLPKVEDYETYLFLVVHGVDFNRADGVFATAELNIFISGDYLVTYHEQPLKSVTATMERARKNTPPVPRAPDRLMHTLLDLLFEHYRPALDELNLETSELESRALTDPSAHILNNVLSLKKEVRHLRQIVSPQVEVIGRLARGDYKYIRAHLRPYFRDILDLLRRISDRADAYHDSLNNVLQIHLSMQQQQTNQVIKVLTVVTVISLPALAVGAWYGMNFQYMPEVHSEWGQKYGYYVVMVATWLVTAVIALFFKWRKWF